MSKFWTEKTFEPKQSFKWRVFIGSSSSRESLPSFFAKSVKKPSFTVDMKSYNLVNRQVKHPSNLIWEPVDITFIDSTESKITSFIKQYLQSAEYTNVNSSTLTNTTTSKTGATNFLTDELNYFIIQQFNSDGFPVETWRLYNPQIASFTASDLDYSNDELSTYTFTIHYDWATLDEQEGSLTSPSNQVFDINPPLPPFPSNDQQEIERMTESRTNSNVNSARLLANNSQDLRIESELERAINVNNNIAIKAKNKN